MTVALHPTETRVASAPLRAAPGRNARAVVLAGLGVAALAGFAAGASTLFSGLADPRARAPRVSPMAANWPDLRDGVPGLAADRTDASPAKPTLNLLPASAGAPSSDPLDIRPTAPTEAALTAPPIAPQSASLAKPDGVKSEVAKSEVANSEVGKTDAARRDAARSEGVLLLAKRTPTIVNASIVPPAERSAPVVAPTRTATALPPARGEIVRAKDAQRSRLASLTPDPETPAPPPALAPKRKPVQATRSSATVVKSASAAPTTRSVVEATARPSATDEPELLGVKIPGGRQIRDGLNAVGGLFTGKSED